MSLKKYKKFDRHDESLFPRRLNGNSDMWNYYHHVEGWHDYYDWPDSDGDGYYQSGWEYLIDTEFMIDVYGEWIDKRRGHSTIGKRIIGSYVPPEVWLGEAGRRDKRIDELLGVVPDMQNRIGDFVVRERR